MKFRRQEFLDLVENRATEGGLPRAADALLHPRRLRRRRLRVRGARLQPARPRGDRVLESALGGVMRTRTAFATAEAAGLTVLS